MVTGRVGRCGSGFDKCVVQGQLNPAKLGQSAQAAYGGVSRIGLVVQIVEHLVSVVGAHRDHAVGAALVLGTPRFLDQRANDPDHVDVAVAVVGLVAAAGGIAHGAGRKSE